MWGFQESFCRGFELAVRSTFEQIGFGVGPRAFLVGFDPDPDSARRHPVCFESELDPMAAVDLSGVAAEARARYEASDVSKTIYGSQLHGERAQQGYRDGFRIAVLREALEESAEGAGLTFFVARSAAMAEGGYEVHPVIAVPTARWESKPALSTAIVGRYRVSRSFQHAVMAELLALAVADLERSVPQDIFMLRRSERAELIRRAASQFVESVSVYSGSEFPSELAVALDEVSAQPYEGRSGSGTLLLAVADNPHVEQVLEFLQPVGVSETRSMRKALEMANRDHHLLCDGAQVFGLATLSPSYAPEDENAFMFHVRSRGVWELSHNKVPLLRVSNTRPTLPEPEVSPEEFKSTAHRVFPHISSDDADRLWDLANNATKASHGTMLVVHEDATNEAKRLVPQAQLIGSRVLNQTVLSAVTNIDGAVMVDPTGVCHAVGVILDGQATGDGDSSRGARYNSAVRYHQSHTGRCLVIIVSEDGMINLLPDLRRQVQASAVESAVSTLEKSVRDGALHDFYRHWRHVEAIAFYLTADQCERANAARDQHDLDRAAHQELEDRRNPNNGMGRITHVGWTRLTPDPDMNDSYYLPEVTV